MPTETRAGIDTHWDEMGEGQLRLMLHCSLAMGRALMPLAKALKQGRAILPDLPGHGQSGDVPEGRDYVEAAIRMAETFLDGPTDMIGHSLGGVVALGVAVRNPDKVRSLTLIEPVFFAAARGTDSYRRHEADHRPIMDDIDTGDREAATRAFMKIWGTGQSWESLPEQMRNAMVARIHLVQRSGPGLGQDTARILADGGLERIAAPVLLVQGSDTHEVVAEILNALAARLPNAKAARIDGAGHMAPLTHTEAVARAIADGRG